MISFFKLISITLLLSAFTLSNSSAQSVWQWQEPQPTGNFMRALDFIDENTGYAAGNVGTVMKTTNGGINWELKNIGFEIILLSIFFIDENTGFVSGGNSGTILKTTNGGDNWQNVFSGGTTFMWDINFPTRNTGYAVGLNGRIFKSTDSGLNWSQQNSNTTVPFFCVDFLDSLNGTAGGGAYVTKTTNGGMNWINQNITFTDPFSQVTSLNFIDQSNIYGLTTGKSEFLKTTNGGVTWNFNPINYPSFSDIPRKMSFNGLNNGNIVTDLGYILSTSNSGTSWAIDSSIKPIYRQIGVLFNVERVSEQTAYVSGSGGRVIKSTNGGVNWFTTTGGRYNYNSNYFVNQNTGFTAGNDGKILKTTNAGLNWIEKQSNTIQNLNEVTFADENTGYVCGDTGTVLKTTDGGESWMKLNSGVFESLTGINFINNQLGTAIGILGRIIRTQNGGTNWNIISSVLTNELRTVQFVDEFTGYIGGSNLLLKSTNAGESWFDLMSSSGLHTQFLNSELGYSTGGSGIIGKTTNGGLNWTIQNGGVAENLNTIYFIDPNNGFAAGDGGSVTRTTNGGTIWIPQTRLTNNNLKSVFFTDANYGYITGDFGTLIKTTNGGLVFISTNSETIPEDFTLYQNYPNPFNSSTVIRYDIKRQGNVDLKLYDITGKLVSTLVKEVQERGSYSVLFSPENYEMKLQSGVYFYTLIIDSKTHSTKKLLYIK